MQRMCGLSLTVLAGTILLSRQPVIAAAPQPTAELTQIAQAKAIEITNIQIEETATGLTISLETQDELSTPETSVIDNAVITTIPNAVLRLANGDDFLANEPAADIALVNVTNLPNNQVQIVITGTDTVPNLEISTAAMGLLVSVTSGMPTVQVPEDDALRIVVTGAEENDYFIPAASTATRTDTPLRDIPNAIQVIPRQVIENQQAISIEEVIENAAGATFQGDSFGSGVLFNVRGFEAQVLRDGFAFPGPRGDFTNPETAGLEQVEVLRGPASILYGQVDPGGVINLVTKKPLPEPYYKFQLQGGTRGFISPSIDLSGPLTEDGRLLYRLNALYRREESIQDYDNDRERFFIAPTLAWQISDSTDLTLNLQYVADNEPDGRDFPALGRDPAPIPRDQVSNNPDDSQEQAYLNVGYTLEHRFSDSWKLRNRFVYTDTSNNQPRTAVPLFLNPVTGDLSRFFLQGDEDATNYSLYTNLQGKFETGSVQHTLLFGVDLSRTEDSNFGFFDFFTPDVINIFNPDYLGAIPPLNPATTFGSDTTTEQLGIYLQDQIDLLDNLILVAGLRYDTVDVDTVTPPGPLGPGTETSQVDDALTPRIGIVYQPIEPISLYANYARSFVPNGGTDANGNPFDPEEGEGFELGIKGEIIENRLSATLAYFDITKQNVVTGDPAVPFASIATGEQRSRGVDLTLNGEIMPGWNIIASYAYIDAEITEDNTIPVGNRLNNTPEHSASLWTTYEIQSGDLQGLGFGLGFNFVDERQDLFDTVDADSYFVTNAAVFYRRDNWRFQINVDNLFDIDYEEFVSSGGAANFGLGDPTTVRASISYKF
ncbi:MAG: TonB-dependent siderophore receptor [Cyanobacteria bacterium P01_B01_bin.77]